MKPPERFPPDDPREWLNRARSNLARAKVFVPGNYLEDLCFDAQQAAEKAIKAVMIRRDTDFPYIHDLAHLLTILEARGEDTPHTIRHAANHSVRRTYPLSRFRRTCFRTRVSGGHSHRRSRCPMGGGMLVIPRNANRALPTRLNISPHILFNSTDSAQISADILHPDTLTHPNQTGHPQQPAPAAACAYRPAHAAGRRP